MRVRFGISDWNTEKDKWIARGEAMLADYQIEKGLAGTSCRILSKGKPLAWIFSREEYATDYIEETLIAKRLQQESHREWCKARGFKRDRDSRRKRSYRAEWAANAAVRPADIFRDVSDFIFVPSLVSYCSEMAERVRPGYGATVAKCLRVTLRNTRRRGNLLAHAQGWTITFFGDNRYTRSVILHELAHVLHQRERHSAAWASTFVRLCEAEEVLASSGYARALRGAMEQVHPEIKVGG